MFRWSLRLFPAPIPQTQRISFLSPGCRPLSFVYPVFQVFWQDDVYVDLGSAVQVIYLTRNAESRYFQCALGLSCAWPKSQWWLASLVWQGICSFILLVFWELRRANSIEQIPAINLQLQLPILYEDYWVIPSPFSIRNMLQHLFQKYLIMIPPQALPCLLLREVLRFRNEYHYAIRSFWILIKYHIISATE